MANGLTITAWEGGTLRVVESDESSREAVLALPLNRLLVKMLRVPPDAEDGDVAYATPFLQAMSPYPDEPLTVSCEEVRSDESGRIVIAAAMPEASASDELGEALDSRKLSVTRIDALALGALRGLWNALGTEDGARRIVLLAGVECLELIVLDGDGPSAIRAVSARSTLKREIMLSLLEAEDFGGAKPLKEIVVVETPKPETEDSDSEEAEVAPESAPMPLDLEALETFAPVRKIEIGEDAALVGVSERSTDSAALNALPESWREMLEETRFKAKLTRRLAVAGGVWALLLAVMLGVPFAFGLMTDHQKDLSKKHQKKYLAVKEMKDKADLIRKYSDHARGALEIMKAVSDRLPPSVTLNKFDFKRGEGVKVSGEAEVKDDVYAYKDALAGILVTDEQGEEGPLFKTVNMNGPSASRGGFKFDLDCLYESEEAE